jgi:hypothetical protein
MSEAVSVAAMDRVCLITATAAIRAGAMKAATPVEASAAPVEASAADAAAVATASAGKGATASSASASAASPASPAATTARIGADRSEREGASHDKYGYCSFD